MRSGGKIGMRRTERWLERVPWSPRVTESVYSSRSPTSALRSCRSRLLEAPPRMTLTIEASQMAPAWCSFQPAGLWDGLAGQVESLGYEVQPGPYRYARAPAGSRSRSCRSRRASPRRPASAAVLTRHQIFDRAHNAFFESFELRFPCLVPHSHHVTSLCQDRPRNGAAVRPRGTPGGSGRRDGRRNETGDRQAPRRTRRVPAGLPDRRCSWRTSHRSCGYPRGGCAFHPAGVTNRSTSV